MKRLAGPVLDALAPADPDVAVRRCRNILFAAALLAALAPRAAELGAGDERRQNATAGILAAGAVFQWWFAGREHSLRWGVLGVALTAAAVWPRFEGAPAIPLVLAGMCLAHLGLSALRPRLGVPPARAASRGPLPAGLAASFASVLILREFALLPVFVPTGSMAPTIRGAEPPDFSADHVLVDRTAWLFREPRRFEIAVFEYPLHRPTNFVKRIVGLPGETIEIADGDLRADGSVCVKPDLVQESMWRELFPRTPGGGRPIDVASAFAETGKRSVWSKQTRGVRCAPAGEPSWFQWTRGAETGDLRVGAVVQFAGPLATAMLRVTHRDMDVVAEGGARNTVRIGSGEAVAFTPAVPSGARFELSVADGIWRVAVDGRIVARGECGGGSGRRNACALGASGAAVDFEEIRVEQDVVYRPGDDRASKWTVPEGSYFCLGDNTRNSQDGRAWRVTEFDVAGRPEPLRAAGSLTGDSGATRGNIRSGSGRVEFTDIDGVPRSFASSEIVSRRDGVPWSFVPRDHLHGRALLIFWPWMPKAGGFRPRILP